jgi:mediator of RNA polymerase II transcription subunit 14
VAESLPPHRTRPGQGPATRTPQQRARDALARRAALGAGGRASDTVEGLRLRVTWAPEAAALGVALPPGAAQASLTPGALTINPADLDLPALLHAVLAAHAHALLRAFGAGIAAHPAFAGPGAVTLVDAPGATAATAKTEAEGAIEGEGHAAPRVLRVRLCMDEAVFVTLEARTGLLRLSRAGELDEPADGKRGLPGAADDGRGRLALLADSVNLHPASLLNALILLRLKVCAVGSNGRATAENVGSDDRGRCRTAGDVSWSPDVPHAELCARRSDPFAESHCIQALTMCACAELKKLGPAARSTLYIPLQRSPRHHLVLVVTDGAPQCALISVGKAPPPASGARGLQKTDESQLVMEDIGWIDVARALSGGRAQAREGAPSEVVDGAECVACSGGPGGH